MQTASIEVSHKVLYVDDDIIVAIKPAGLLAVPGRGTDKQDCLSARLAVEFDDAVSSVIHIVHRLDQATSGLMVFARNLFALRNLHAQFRTSTVDKAYEAIVHGNVLLGKPSAVGFVIDLPLSADWPNRPKQKVDTDNGKPSTTHVEVLSFNAATNTSRVRLLPDTGRTHQLRVHLMAIGHAIVGDALYGAANGSQAISDQASHPPSRLLLHAMQLAFTHPATGERRIFESAPNF